VTGDALRAFPENDRAPIRDKAIRIAYVTSSKIPDVRANSYQSVQMADAFSRCGADVTFIHPAGRHLPARTVQMADFWREVGLPTMAFRLKPVRALDPGRPRLAGWEKMVAHLKRRFALFERCWYALAFGSFAFLVAVHVARRRARYDMVYTRSEWTVTSLGRIKRWIQIPIVFELHHIGSLARTVRRARAADWVVSNTHEMRNALVSAGVPANRISVAPSGVNLARFQMRAGRDELRRGLGLPTTSPIVGYIGRFRSMAMEKGVPELLQAVARVAPGPGGEPVALCVGGPLDGASSYEEVAARAGLSPARVRLIDHVSFSTVPDWIGACDLVTIPWTRTEFSARDTSPLKLFEYMASGVPIVASDLPAIREVLRHGENAWLVPPGDPQALADGIQHLLSCPELASRLADQARRDVTGFGWESRARRIRSDVGPLLAATPRRSRPSPEKCDQRL
jgi:glycosyltransferase involved in cell wall biosynthesis